MRRISVIPGLLWLLPGPALAWHDRAVTIVAPFGPGTSQDVLARLLAPRMQAAWGQPVVVTGAAGTIGVDRVAKSPPAYDYPHLRRAYCFD